MRAVAVGLAIGAAHAGLVRLGRSYGAKPAERAMELPGDGLVHLPEVVTDHAVSIDAPAAAVWPWLVQMGWRRGGWYTARWVDRLLLLDNRPSADRIVPELQRLQIGDFVADGRPETGCGFIVRRLDPERALVLHSTSHLAPRWHQRPGVAVDWSWAFVLRPSDDRRRTRLHLRSRWRTGPRRLTPASRLVVIPADFVLSRDLLRGVKVRAEAGARSDRWSLQSVSSSGVTL